MKTSITHSKFEVFPSTTSISSSSTTLSGSAASRASALVSALTTWLVSYTNAAGTRAMDTVESISSFVTFTRKAFQDRVSGVAASVRGRSARVFSFTNQVQKNIREMVTQSFVKAQGTLIGACTTALSYVPSPITYIIGTSYTKAHQAREMIRHFVTSRIGAVAHMVNLAKWRYVTTRAHIGSIILSTIYSAKAMTHARLEKIKSEAYTVMTKVWNHVPLGVKARLCTIADSASAKGKVAWQQTNAAWKYTTEDPKARTTVKATAGGAAAGGATGFITGGTVGAIIGIVPAVFTFGLSIPVGAVIGSSIGLSCGAATGGAVGFASGAAYANKAEMTRSASRCKEYVKDQAASIHDKASESMSAVTRKLRRSGTGGTA